MSTQCQKELLLIDKSLVVSDAVSVDAMKHTTYNLSTFDTEHPNLQVGQVLVQYLNCIRCACWCVLSDSKSWAFSMVDDDESKTSRTASFNESHCAISGDKPNAPSKSLCIKVVQQ
jgi:hypothetical protein